MKLIELNLNTVQQDADLEIEKLAKKLIGYSGADITNVCRDAAMMPMRRRIANLSPEQILAIPKSMKVRNFFVLLP